VPDLDKERPYAIPLVRPLPIPHLHGCRKMEACLINFKELISDPIVLNLSNKLSSI
jgi:hypothetical protein